MSRQGAERRSPLRRLWRSLAFRLSFLIAAFVVVPIFIYGTFKTAADERRRLFLQEMQIQVDIIAAVIYPQLVDLQGAAIPDLADSLGGLTGPGLRVKLLFRPASTPGSQNFFYVASSPEVGPEYLSQERQQLIKLGLLERLRDTCEGYRSQGLRFTNPAGSEEILIAVKPLQTASGCWALMSSRSISDRQVAALWQPYWQRPEVRYAAGIYVLLAVVVFSLFFDLWRNLRRFGRLAEAVRAQRRQDLSFAAHNEIPELDGVAGEFDRLVQSLTTSARWIRYMAEDNAHALKTPIGVIAQSIEPLRRLIGPGDQRGGRALQMIETSVSRLDRLVSQARQLGETAAELLEAPHEVVALSGLVGRMIEDYGDGADRRDIASDVQPAIRVLGSPDLIETVIENLLDNALSFSPAGAPVTVSLRRENRRAVLTVADRGPGVPPSQLERIFERYYSVRPAAGRLGTPARGDDGDSHFGIGLWIARRNVEAMGGTITAANQSGGGLVMRVELVLYD